MTCPGSGRGFNITTRDGQKDPRSASLEPCAVEAFQERVTAKIDGTPFGLPGAIDYELVHTCPAAAEEAEDLGDYIWEQT